MSAALIGVALATVAFNPSWPPDDTNLSPDAFARPERMPDDPEYAPRVTVDGCVGQHELYGFVPDCVAFIDDAERRRQIGVGASVDRAWAWTIGRRSIVVAPLADGVDWNDADLVNKWYLDPGELPMPRTSTAALGYDANGDGVFNVQDYTSATGTITPTVDRVTDATLLARADRGDVNNNGMLDPGDLLKIFADGVDDDGDGYVDDIAGWDHFDDDNDPGVAFGASPAARWIGAAANNEIGGAGACPGCTLLAMRVARDGTAPGHTLPLALLYATDEGAAVLASFSEMLEATTFLADAVDYAMDRRRLIVASTGTRGDRRRPVAWDPDRVLIVGSVGYDTSDNREATTSLAPDPCAGYGAQLAVVGPGRCDQRGAAIAAGVAGLVLTTAAGLPERGVAPLDPPLSSREALAVLRTSAVDARPTDLLETDEPQSTSRGWDARTGHGRVDALAAVETIVQRRIPPPTIVEHPRWYDVVDATIANFVEVRARVDAVRGSAVGWTLEAAPGLEPTPDAFVSIASGTTDVAATVAGEVAIAGLFRDAAAPPRTRDDFVITARLVTRQTTGGDVVSSETRRVFYVHRDLDLLPGFPIRLASGVVAGPRVLDADLDGAPECLVATVDGALVAIDREGRTEQRLTSAPSRRGRHDGAPALDFLAPDLRETLVAAPSAVTAIRAPDGPWTAVRGSEGTLQIIERRGAPSTLAAPTLLGATSSPTLFDVDGDGAIDIVTVEGTNVVVRRRDGSSLPGWPVAIDGLAGTPSVGDVDDDGRTEVVVATATTLFVIEADGEVLSIRLPAPDVLVSPIPFGPSTALGDLDGDRVTDIVVPVRGGAAVQRDTGARSVTTLRTFGGGADLPLEGSPLLASSNQIALGVLDGRRPSTVLPLAAAPTLARLPPDRAREVAYGAFDDKGRHVAGFPRRAEAPGFADPLIADLDGDRRPEVVFAEPDRIRALAFDGSTPRGFPKLTGDEVVGTPVVEDLDGDGLLELVAVTRSGLVFVWRTRGPADGVVAWNGAHHDLQATGNLAVPTLGRATVERDRGCDCTSAPGAPAWASLVLGLLLLRRRRR